MCEFILPRNIKMEIASSASLEREKITSPITAAANGVNNTRSPPLRPTPTPPLTPRSHDANPCPTPFVQADTSNFKQVVQMLTGSTETARKTPASGIPPIKSACQKKQGFKLFERRKSMKNGLMINTAGANTPSPRNPDILSPSMLDFPSLALSPMTPLNGGASSKSPSPTAEEEKAIAEKNFYLHQSPRTKSGEPELLHLFPMTSPRVYGSS